ncbi:MAG: sugar ABC transporter ATP-binding protein [Acetobacteraceae bacterium]
MTEGIAILAADGVSKSFGGAAALRGVSLALHGGEAHALLGENGAGKSTLVRILAGVVQPDRGEILLNGRPLLFRNPAEARAAGVAVIYQEPTLFPDLSIAENVLIGRWPRRSWGRIDHRRSVATVASLFAGLGVDLDPARLVRGLSIAGQQLVEIAKALSYEARVLIMDEPTAALTGEETARLFTVVRRLRSRSVAILFITHRLEEAFAECQRLTVLRDGSLVDSGPIGRYTPAEVVRLMVGRALGTLYPARRSGRGQPALAVRGLVAAGVYAGINFDVHRGEIVALAGLVGAGRSEVLRGIFGIDPRDGGTVHAFGREVPPRNPRAAMRMGLALVPEDRRQQGLVLELSIIRNATLAVLRQLCRGPFSSPAEERAVTAHWATRLQLKFRRLSDAVGTLSGGNQQKVVLSKWLATAPKILLIDEPTRGIDVGAKAELHHLVAGLAEQGLAVLMVSSELPEVLGMADRILVMREGRIRGEIDARRASEEAVMAVATGQEGALGAAPEPA